jgi:branched-chain amino acid transport system permease protein
MLDFFAPHLPLLDLIFIGTGYALSQAIVFRAGTFSVATSGFAALGAYAAAILTVKHGVPPAVSVALGTLLGLLCGLMLSIPLARLRGVYQAIASLAFVEILVALILYFDDLTGGPLGFNNIPRVVSHWTLFFAVVGTMALLIVLGQGAIGRVFDAMRQDPPVAASLGVNPTKYHVLSFALSGAIAGLFGGLDALRNFSLTADQFGFGILIGTLSAVVLGGRRSVLGPLIGTSILVLLPEIFRPLADYRQAIYGLLLVVVMAFLPYGVYDSIVMKLHNRRLARAGMLKPKAQS